MKNVIDIKNLIEQIQQAINNNNFSVLSQKYPVKIYKNMTFDIKPEDLLANDEMVNKFKTQSMDPKMIKQELENKSTNINKDIK